MVSIMHISDLHIAAGADWNNMREALLAEAREKVQSLPQGQKLLVVTGDLHNFREGDYQGAKSFLEQLIKVMDIDPGQDVFLVPGNHDVGNRTSMSGLVADVEEWEMRQEAAVSNIKAGKTKFMGWRMETYQPYCRLVRDLGIYAADAGGLPAQCHVRSWRGKLNLLHLNTTLVADGTAKSAQMVDAEAATGEAIWEALFDERIPALALGHNSFFDLTEQQQVQLEAAFLRRNVSAYLCGDLHLHEGNRNRQLIRLESGYQSTASIPNVVCMKSAADEGDTYSEFGFYWHEWDEETNRVTLTGRIWKRGEDQSRFQPMGSPGVYPMRTMVQEPPAPALPEDPNQQLRRLRADMEAARTAYFDYLTRDLGYIQFDGIPTDKEAGAVRAPLEQIFVPLRFRPVHHGQGEHMDDAFLRAEEVHPVRFVLTDSPRAALLAKPGGGKSTLIRRIALAYAATERRDWVEDDLPEADWFPVYLRCRDLGEGVQKPITDLIYGVIQRAELTEHTPGFCALIQDAMNTGQMLLLVDGLDEITNETHRMQFVEHLETFVNTHPDTHLLITSRKSGFRAVAQKLAGYCRQYEIEDLNQEQIQQLSDNWHHALLDNPVQAKQDSQAVCRIILHDARILTLAKTPLLLTTLLFVRRWLGYLPTKKCQLYQEMIKLLLVSWNAAAHHRIVMDEAEPQLAYVAYQMTKAGKQTIQRKDLLQCIADSRHALPALLEYTRNTPAEFVQLVEDRSSILIQQGLEEDERGNMVPSYEFSHLSFQEYLTAKAISEYWVSEPEYPDAKSLFRFILEHFYGENQWREVIPLTAGLLKRDAGDAMAYLLSTCQEGGVDVDEDTKKSPNGYAALHLASCIASEVPVTPDFLDEALLSVLNRSALINAIRQELADDRRVDTDVFATIYHSEKYGERLQAITEKEAFENPDCQVNAVLRVWKTIYFEEPHSCSLEDILEQLRSGSPKEATNGLLLFERWVGVKLGYGNAEGEAEIREKADIWNGIFEEIAKLICQKHRMLQFAVVNSLCIVGSALHGRLPKKPEKTILEAMARMWSDESETVHFQVRASFVICMLIRPGVRIQLSPMMHQAIQREWKDPVSDIQKMTAFCLKILGGKATVTQLRQNQKWKKLLWLCPLLK